jgi:hypothetical protein
MPAVTRSTAYAHGRYITRALANLYRPDLRAAAVGSGCHGFACRVPPNCAGVVEVRREADHAPLQWAGTLCETKLHDQAGHK